MKKLTKDLKNHDYFLEAYYYAHLRQNSPFQKGLKEGSVVTAGDVIGYMGHTGYSKKGGQQDHNPQSHSTSYNTYCTT